MKEEVVLRLGLLQNNIDGSFLKFRFEKFEGRVRSGEIRFRERKDSVGPDIFKDIEEGA